MKEIKVPGRKKPVRTAEWKDVKKIVERLIKRERKYLALMSNL